MKGNYTVKFSKDDNTTEERNYSLINSSTVRARSIMLRFFKITESGSTEFNSEFFSDLYKEESVLNELMSQILVGNHENLTWFNADSKALDEILTDFFTSFIPKIKKSS